LTKRVAKKIVINGGRPLRGDVVISGSKNSTVALIPATLLADSPVVLEGVPEITDVLSLIEILEIMGADIKHSGDELIIDSTNVRSVPMPSGKINSLRASYYFMGALLGRFGEAVVGLPGGCNLGSRPIDLHIKGFIALGARVSCESGAVFLKTGASGLIGNRVFMDTISVGATINIMLAAIKAKGKTIIENSACEPEIIDVATLLNNMGAIIRGAGTSEIRIEGVEYLAGTRHSVIPDRIEAGTYLAMAASTGLGVTLHNVLYEHLESFIAKLKEMGIQMTVREDSITVCPPKELSMVNIKTFTYPGFATDLQQTITPLLLKATGQAKIVDTIYSGRINHVPELIRMGADIRTEGDLILLNGPNKLVGTEVFATDLRAGACLVTAGLIASGQTVVHNADLIMRGYSRMVEKLTNLGADIALMNENVE